MVNTDECKEIVFKRLPDAELEIMQIIWAASGPVTSADVMDRIRPRGRWATTTVLNFLGRLVEKGFVRTRKQGKFNIYFAVADETTYLQQAGKAMLHQLFNGSATKMVSALFEANVLDEDDLLELHEYIIGATEIPGIGEEPKEAAGGSRWTSWYKRHFRFD